MSSEKQIIDNETPKIIQSKEWSLSIECFNKKTNNYDLTLEETIVKIKHETHYYFGIMHDKDYDKNGEIRKKHIHIVIKLQAKRTLNGILKRFSKLLEIDINRISAQIIKSQVAIIRYLMHIDNKDKTPYPPFKVVTNREDILKLAIKGEIEKEDLTAESLIITIEKTGGNKLKIMGEIGLKNYTRYRGAIIDIIGELENSKYLISKEQQHELMKRQAQEERVRIKALKEYTIKEQAKEIERVKEVTIKGIRKEINQVAVEVLNKKKNRK